MKGALIAKELIPVVLLFLLGVLLGVFMSGCQKPTGNVIITDLEEVSENLEQTIEIADSETEAADNETGTPETPANETENATLSFGFATGEKREKTIVMKNLSYEPDELAVKRGTTVIWVHEDRFEGRNDIMHIVMAHFNKFRSPPMRLGQSFNVTFDEPGNYTFFDVVYPEEMKGKIVVGD